jgi:hypothetical protein
LRFVGWEVGMAGRFLGAVVAGVMLCGAAQGEPPVEPSAPAGGIYVIVDAANTAQYDLAAETLKQPDVDGLLIHLHWSDVNKAEGSFDWKALNATVALAMAAHKRFELGIVTGKQTPDWVLDKTEKLDKLTGTFSYNAAMSNKPTSACENKFAMAAPWAAAYRTAFRALLHGLQKDLHETGAYDSLGMIKLFGITTTTNELRLPVVPAPACKDPTLDPLNVWWGLHYRPSKVDAAWLDMLAAYRMEFPDKAFNIGFIGKNAFPGIPEHGKPPTDKATREEMSAKFTQHLIDEAAAAFPGKLALGFDSLTGGTPVASYTAYLEAFTAAARQADIPGGWQTNELLGNYPYGGASCTGNAPVKTDDAAEPVLPVEPPAAPEKTLPCMSSADFRDMLLAVINPPVHPPEGLLPAVYFEVFPQNVVMYPSALTSVHAMLAPWPNRK